MNEAALLYQQAIQKDKSYVKAYSTLANLYHRIERNTEETHLLQEAIAHTESEDRQFKMRLIRAAFLSGQYELAQHTLNEFDTLPISLQHLQACVAFSLDAKAHATNYQPQNMGPQINTKYDDYWPYISIDEQEITTTVLVKNDSNDFFTSNEDLYKSEKTAEGWSKSKAISPIINSSNNEGAQCLSADGKTMLFTACNRSTGIGSCDLFITYQNHGTWSAPKALPEPINSKYWDGHPSLSADGQYLYFASDRIHGIGKRDIYRATIAIKNDNVKVKKIQHLGANINTSEDEVSPFIHPDGKTLYFSSNGHVGLGRMDIFKTQISDDFSAPITNLGYPVNTHSDDIGFIVNTAGNTAYFSSQRNDSQKKDIYSFALNEAMRPEATSYFKAILYNAENNKQITAKVELRHLANDKIYYQNDNIDEFIIPIRCHERYAISIEKAGFLFYSSQFSPEKESASPLIKEIYLRPIKTDQSIVLHNILFEFNTAKIDTSFSSELHKALVLMHQNPKLHFCIEGHTDTIGNIAYNQKLSEERALAVQQYFIKHGIDSMRLNHKGYGSSRPISANPAENRRTELRIIPPPAQKQ